MTGCLPHYASHHEILRHHSVVQVCGRCGEQIPHLLRVSAWPRFQPQGKAGTHPALGWEMWVYAEWGQLGLAMKSAQYAGTWSFPWMSVFEPLAARDFVPNSAQE